MSSVNFVQYMAETAAEALRKMTLHDTCENNVLDGLHIKCIDELKQLF